MKARIVWVALAVALAALVGTRVAAVARNRASNAAKPPAETPLVRSAHVARMTLAERVSFTGTVRPRSEVEVFAKVPGRIERLDARVGATVRAGDVLAVVEHDEIGWQAKAASAAVAVARAGLEGARVELERTRALFDGGSAPPAQLDGARLKLSLARAQLAQARASAGLAQQQLSNATIVAPVDGTVVKRLVTVGAQVGPASSIVTLQDVHDLKVEASVDAAAFARLALGAEALVRVDALPGETFVGAVSVLSPSLDAASRRAAIEIDVDNEAGRLMPNMFAQVEVVVGRDEDAVAVPRAAVLESAGGAAVFRVKDGRAELVRPRLGSADGDWVRVVSGLEPDDEVAVSGLPSLSDGMPVKTVPEAPADTPAND